MPGNNAAQRTLNVLQRFGEVAESVGVSQGLLTVMGPVAEGLDTHRENARRLEVLLGQLDRMEENLRAQGFPTALYERHLVRARSAFNPQMLSQPWAAVKNACGLDVVVAFEWAAFALDDEGEFDFDAGLDLIDQALALLKHDFLTHLPSGVREGLRAAIDALVEAVRMGPLQGAAPVAKAVRDLSTEIDAEKEALREYMSPQYGTSGGDFAAKAGRFLGAARDALGRTYEGASKHADKLEKIGKAVDRGYKAIQYIAEHVDKLPSAV